MPTSRTPLRPVCAVACLGLMVLGQPSGVSAADPPTCFGQPATIVGTAGADDLIGTSQADVIVGLGGIDEVDGLGGADKICGGGDIDLLSGGAGPIASPAAQGTTFLTGARKPT